ncbi:hypothetical protein CQ018_01540 [Arthrobacter sp. MYb227]|uniref:hypothetical protein n=1 Tax=Arthrobacter sp. MYb227 TaxID=1848601 RepID=UPI000CFC13EB|nr:hypothetical protein [Arthrobacter sp. MYb227]PQZ95996.1 hypothetical protein CQ018_01540 [Arthrobacter sp. MYb227]
MPTVARKFLALLLAILAVLAAGVGLGARTADQLINTPEPLQRILGPLATHDQLREILPQVLSTQLTTQITESIPVPIPSALSGILEQAIATSSSALLGDATFATAWGTTIENTRRDYIEELATAKAENTHQATIKLDLAPLLSSAYGTLYSSLGGSMLGALLPATISMPQVLVDTNWPDEQTLSAPDANRWLGLAGAWGWFIVAAGVLTMAAIFVAPRGFRGKTLIALGGSAVVLGAVVIYFAAKLSGIQPQESELTDLLITQLAQGVRGEVQSISNTLIIGGVVVFLAGLGTWLWRRENQVLDTAAATPVAN